MPINTKVGSKRWNNASHPSDLILYVVQNNISPLPSSRPGRAHSGNEMQNENRRPGCNVGEGIEQHHDVGDGSITKRLDRSTFWGLWNEMPDIECAWQLLLFFVLAPSKEGGMNKFSVLTLLQDVQPEVSETSFCPLSKDGMV